MSKPQIMFARLSKYDAGTGEFEAVAADETLDKSKEIFDYDTSKPYFQKWGDEFAKNTDGKSVGNVRSMHGKNAAGKLTYMLFDDEKKRIVVRGKVVDDRDALKMSEGVYTGVSIGGDYVKRWDDDVVKGAQRYTADPCEVSLVDNPCNPSARFMFKAAGAEAEVEKPLTGDTEKAAVDALAKILDGGKVKPSAVLKMIEDAAKPAPEKREALKKALGNPELTHGDLEKLAAEHLPGSVPGAGDADTLLAALFKAYDFTEAELKEFEDLAKREFSQAERDKAASSGAAMPDGSYPIKSTADLKNAIQAIGRAKNPDAVKRHIKRRAKALGATDLIPEGWGKAEDATGLVKDVEAVAKGLDTIGWLARLLSDLHCLADSCEYEAMMEDDGSALPARLNEACAELGEILCEMAEEETQEEANKAVMRDGLTKVFEKYGARHSAADKGRLQKIHDHAVDMGAECGAGKGQSGSLSKLFGGATGDELTKRIEVAVEKAAKYDKMPIRKGVVRAIGREEDAGNLTQPKDTGKTITAEVIGNARKALSGDVQAHAWLLMKGFGSDEIDGLAKTEPPKA